MWTCLFKLGSSHKICKVSLIFRLWYVLAESITLKQLSLQESLHAFDFCRCLSTCKSLSVKSCSRILVEMCQHAKPKCTELHPAQVTL